MTTTLRSIANAALDLLFPPKCAVCDREGAYLCAECEPRLRRLERPYCDLCAGPATESICSWCGSAPPAFDGIRAPYRYAGSVRDMVHDLKYRGLRSVAPVLGRLLHTYLEKAPRAADLIVPVPLHRSRERERGYNQSALLAKELSRLTGIPSSPGLLLRTRDTAPQVTMEGHEQRRRNIAGAFECAGDPSGLSLLLVDDVVTTGGTMNACAEPLKAKGAASVWGLSLAR